MDVLISAETWMSRADRRYGLYSSRSRGKWIDKPYVARLAPSGWKRKHLQSPDSPEAQEDYNPDCSVCSSESRAAWARLIAKVYEVNPLECAKCHSPMKILAVITDPEEVKKIPVRAILSKLASLRRGLIYHP